MNALRALLSGIVDYAGLFPPASLDMTAAVTNYVAYREDSSSWMLGRFVVPVARLQEVQATLSSVPHLAAPIRLSALLGADIERDVEEARAFNNAHGEVCVIDTLEARLPSADAIRRAGAAAAGEFELFAEVASDPDPAELIAAMAAVGLNAKIRTGGTTPDAFPPAAHVIRFIRRCLDAGVRFKATAGLHHPVRADYALTYDASAPRGPMYGYLNVFMAAGLLARGIGERDAQRVLEDRDAAAFEFRPDSIGWRGHSLSVDELCQLRDDVAVSFGSCSFREPVDELHSLTAVD